MATSNDQLGATLPLSGLKVLDLTRVLAGPMCTMTLGDLGADVIKVERPAEGDESRTWGPPFDERGLSAYYLSVNRNKLSVALDLESAADRSVIATLAAEADVVVDNFRSGTLERRGLDPERFLVAHPKLLWCTITGFGAESRRPGYDFVVQAESGWMAITGEPGGAPIKTGVALADVMAGKDATIAILAGLARRSAATPADRRLIISLMDSARAALINAAQNAMLTGRDAGRWGNSHPNLVPYQLFDASDRGVVIAVGSDAQWRACARALDLADLADDPALGTNAGRLAGRDRIVSAFAAAIGRLPSAQVQRRLDDAGIPNGLVRTVVEAVAEVAASRLSGMPSSVGGTVRRPPPLLDEHGALVRNRGWGAFSS
jgi:crotonobetainyl-CoA:carnitine CoA-transferase CaiB-like acyl-CoA transferase